MTSKLDFYILLIIILLIGAVLVTMDLLGLEAKEMNIFHMFLLIPVLFGATRHGIRGATVTASVAYLCSAIVLGVVAYLGGDSRGSFELTWALALRAGIFFVPALLVGHYVSKIEEARGQATVMSEGAEMALYFQKKQNVSAIESLSTLVEEKDRDINRFSSLVLIVEQIVLELGTHLELDALYKMIIKVLTDVVGSRRCAIYLKDPAGLDFTMVARSHSEQEGNQPKTVAMSDPQVEYLVQSKHMIVRDKMTEGDFSLQDRLDRSELSCASLAPLIEGGEVVGMIAIEELREGEVLDTEVLSIIRNICSMAMSNGRLFQRIQDMANRDGLTKVFNYKYFHTLLEGILEKSRLEGSSFSIVMIDIDHFKKFNDTHGHQAGDAVLINFAETCRKAVGEKGVFARYGGEEFVFVLYGMNGAQGVALADEVRRKVEEMKVSFDDKELKVPASFGVSSFPEFPASTIDQIIKLADAALYKAKHAGRNCARLAGVEDIDIKAQRGKGT